MTLSAPETAWNQRMIEGRSLRQDVNPSSEALLPPGSRIAFVLPALQVGGAEQVVRLLARGMMNRHQVLVVGAFDGGAMAAAFERDGIPWVALHNRRRLRKPATWLLSLAQSVVELRRVLLQFSPQVVNVHLLGPEIDTLLAARLAGIRNAIVTLHSTDPLFASRRAMDRAHQFQLRSVYARFSAAIAISSEVRDWAVNHRIVRSDHVYVVQNGIDLEAVADRSQRESWRKQYRIPAKEFVFISVASLRPCKGHALLFQALSCIPEQLRSRLTLLLAGDGPERHRLEEQVSALGIGDCVRFLGMRDDVPALLALSDAFVVSSSHEGLSMATLEAMATALPVVSTRVAGSTLIIRDGVNGILVPTSSSEELSKALIYCLEHPEAMGRMGRAARASVVSDFGATQMVQATESVFARVTGCSRTR